jgi:hypothetical protein
MIPIPLAFVFAAALATTQSTPDFTGKWTLDDSRSDDAEALIVAGLGDPNRMSPENRRTADRLLQLVNALRVLDIKQGASDFRLFDQADNIRIYYIDGKKHQRETPWGERLETMTKWEGSELHVRTDGKDLGEIDEIYGMEAKDLVYTVKLRLEDSDDEVVVRSFYQRAP